VSRFTDQAPLSFVNGIHSPLLLKGGTKKIWLYVDLGGLKNVEF